MIVLAGKSAIEFERKAKENLKRKGSIDFSKQAEVCRKILAKTKAVRLDRTAS